MVSLGFPWFSVSLSYASPCLSAAELPGSRGSCGLYCQNSTMICAMEVPGSQLSLSYMEVSQNGGTPNSWMIYNEKSEIKWRVWGYPLFRNICRTIPVDGYHHNLYPKKRRRKEFQPQICSNATRKKGARIWLWFNLCGINELMILSNELLDAVDTATLCWLMTRYGISLNHLVQTYLATKGNRYDEPFMVGGEGVILRPWNLVFDTSTKIEYAGRRLVLSSLIILSIEWMTTGSPSFKHPHLYTYIYVYTYSHMYICVFFFLPLGHQQASPSRSLLMPSMA